MKTYIVSSYGGYPEPKAFLNKEEAEKDFLDRKIYCHTNYIEEEEMADYVLRFNELVKTVEKLEDKIDRIMSKLNVE